MDNHYPVFVNEPECANYDPDLWFPQEQAGKWHNWSHTPDAMKARAICASCPALKECFDYSIQYSGLYGIWAGLDWYERDALQKKDNLKPFSMLSTIPHYYMEGIRLNEQ